MPIVRSVLCAIAVVAMFLLAVVNRDISGEARSNLRDIPVCILNDVKAPVSALTINATLWTIFGEYERRAGIRFSIAENQPYTIHSCITSFMLGRIERG